MSETGRQHVQGLVTESCQLTTADTARNMTGIQLLSIREALIQKLSRYLLVGVCVYDNIIIVILTM